MNKGQWVLGIFTTKGIFYSSAVNNYKRMQTMKRIFSVFHIQRHSFFFILHQQNCLFARKYTYDSLYGNAFFFCESSNAIILFKFYSSTFAKLLLFISIYCTKIKRFILSVSHTPTQLQIIFFAFFFLNNTTHFIFIFPGYTKAFPPAFIPLFRPQGNPAGVFFLTSQYSSASIYK